MTYPNGQEFKASGPSPPDVELAQTENLLVAFQNGDNAVVGAAMTSGPVSHWVESTLHDASTFEDGRVLSGIPPPPSHLIRGKAKLGNKKATAAAQRKWLMIDSEGSTSMVTLSKMQLTQSLGVQLRDLRLLDPKLATSYPSAILCREHSLVVNLEFIKMIVGLEKCYITNLEDENAGSFVSELCRRLMAVSQGLPPTKSTMDLTGPDAAAGVVSNGGSYMHASGFDELPFELRVMEVALDVVSQYLERMTGDLEAAAHPALDALTVKVSTDNLERVRRVKNRMVRLTTRVETLREVLEKFLDDDGDMRDMNLAAKEAREVQERAADALRHGSAQPFDVVLPVTGTKTPGSPRSAALTYDSEEEGEEAVEEVEQLLEAYFINLDNTWNKLQTLTEYIDDTEDFINIQLDSQRNQLIRLDLMLTSWTASMALVTAVTSLFAMNVIISPEFPDKLPYDAFLAISIICGVVAVLAFTGVIAYCRWKRLI